MKINTILKIVKKLIYNPKSIFLIFEDETEYKKYLQKKHQRTIFPTIDIREFLNENKGEISNFTFLDGSSLVTDLILLKSIAKSVPNCNYLEIGMWRGESVTNVAEEAQSCITINLSPEEIEHLGLPQKYARLHGSLIKGQKNIKIIYANSLKFDFSSLNQKFDLIFIDGDHNYEAVKSDTKNVINLLKDENSVIVWHDYAYNPEVPRYSVIAGILDGMPKEMHKHLYHISNTMCAVFTKKSFQTQLLEYPVTPDKIFKVNIEVLPFEIDK